MSVTRGETMTVNFGVNYLAVIVATIAAFVIGFVWFGLLFQRQWGAAHNLTREQMRPQGASAVIAIVAPLINAWVLAVLSLNLGAKSLGDAVALGVLVWLGFFATQQAATTAFQRRSWNIFGIDTVHALIVQVVVAAIVTLWR
jgi:hypothetical protein